MEEKLDLIEKAFSLGIVKDLKEKYDVKDIYLLSKNDLRFEIEVAEEEQYLKASLSKAGIVW